MSEAERARKLRRRHMHERQAVIFGVLLSFLALSFVTAAAIYTGNLNIPLFSRAFTAKPTPTVTHDPQPCPPTGALPVPAGDITVNVYNATSKTGLAGSTAKDVRTYGFVVGTIANDPLGKSVTGTGEIRYGKNGKVAASVVRTMLPTAAIVQDARADASLS